MLDYHYRFTQIYPDELGNLTQIKGCKSIPFSIGTIDQYVTICITYRGYYIFARFGCLI
jgi:hypothetical protein